jgi:hypothetical protein
LRLNGGGSLEVGKEVARVERVVAQELEQFRELTVPDRVATLTTAPSRPYSAPEG